MKVRFSLAVEYTPEFAGNKESTDPFKVTLLPVDNEDLLLIVDAFETGGLTGSADPEQLDKKARRAILKLIPTVLPKYVTVTNLFDDDGNPVTIEHVCKYPAFMGLANELLMQ